MKHGQWTASQRVRDLSRSGKPRPGEGGAPGSPPPSIPAGGVEDLRTCSQSAFKGEGETRSPLSSRPKETWATGFPARFLHNHNKAKLAKSRQPATPPGSVSLYLG